MMQPLGQQQRPRGPNVGSKKSPGQQNDTFGASTPSREANMRQQQTRTTGSPAGGQTK